MASHRSSIALFSSTGDNQEWRKEQLDRLRRKFEGEKDIPVIDDDEDLQPMWREMESRVTKRRSVTVAEAGGRVGRSNIRRTDEEAWLQAGMYDQDDEKAKGKDDQGKEWGEIQNDLLLQRKVLYIAKPRAGLLHKYLGF